MTHYWVPSSPANTSVSPECNHPNVVTEGQCEPVAQILCDLVCCGCRVVCVEEHSTSIVEYDLVLCTTTLVAPCLNMCVCDDRHQLNNNFMLYKNSFRIIKDLGMASRKSIETSNSNSTQ